MSCFRKNANPDIVILTNFFIIIHFKLCFPFPGILSPLRSDTSLNDISAFSFGSLPETPEFETPQAIDLTAEFESPVLYNENKKVSN